MQGRKFVIMGGGEVGRHLALHFASEGHAVALIDPDPSVQRVVEDELDVAFVGGSGTQIPTLLRAGVSDCELFVAASSSDDANLVASLLAKRLGAPRSVVRVHDADELTTYGREYESTFAADLLISTQLLQGKVR